MDKKGKVAALDKVEGRFTVQEYPLPDVSPGTLLVRIELLGALTKSQRIFPTRS